MKTYKWIGPNGGWRVGRCAEIDGDLLIAITGERGPAILMREYHTGVLSLVDSWALSEYPSEPIPEPKGGA